MADVELVIKIPEDTYAMIKKMLRRNGTEYMNELEEGVAFGIPLPKGHGDLVDRDKINDRYYEIWKELESYSNKPTYKELLDKWSMCMDTAQPIIEADRESEDKE